MRYDQLNLFMDEKFQMTIFFAIIKKRLIFKNKNDL